MIHVILQWTHGKIVTCYDLETENVPDITNGMSFPYLQEIWIF